MSFHTEKKRIFSVRGNMILCKHVGNLFFEQKYKLSTNLYKKRNNKHAILTPEMKKKKLYEWYLDIKLVIAVNFSDLLL